MFDRMFDRIGVCLNARMLSQWLNSAEKSERSLRKLKESAQKVGREEGALEIEADFMISWINTARQNRATVLETSAKDDKKVRALLDKLEKKIGLYLEHLETMGYTPQLSNS